MRTLINLIFLFTSILSLGYTIKINNDIDNINNLIKDAEKHLLYLQDKNKKLHTNYILLSYPKDLKDKSETFLNLKPINKTQYITIEEIKSQ